MIKALSTNLVMAWEHNWLPDQTVTYGTARNTRHESYSANYADHQFAHAQDFGFERAELRADLVPDST